MKTLAKKKLINFEVSENVYERLCAALIKHGLPFESFTDVVANGADAGYPAITYYNDTCAFYQANKSDIWDLLNESASEMGYNTPLELIATFKGAKDATDATRFENLLTWFAAEEISRYFTNK